MAARKQSAIVGLKVRLREPLRKKLEVAAKQGGVSLNSELVSRLNRSFLSEAMEQAFARHLNDVRETFRRELQKAFDERDKLREELGKRVVGKRAQS